MGFIWKNYLTYFYINMYFNRNLKYQKLITKLNYKLILYIHKNNSNNNNNLEKIYWGFK